jgi:hypothetical protein
LRQADLSSKESYRLCENYYETEEETRAQQTAVEPLMTNERMNESEYVISSQTCFVVENHVVNEVKDTP